MEPAELSTMLKPAEVLHLKRESDEESVHLQALQILHILCFTDVNSETETHFFLVKFLNSYENQFHMTACQIWSNHSRNKVR